jgi:cob(I)alamin adenosyltransferase
MDDERIASLLSTVMDLGKQILAMEGHLAELESAVGALKAFVAAQMFPDDPTEALNQLQTLEKTLFNSDPRTAQRKITQEALEALQQWRRTGVPPHES